jgi:hypothetical protein
MINEDYYFSFCREMQSPAQGNFGGCVKIATGARLSLDQAGGRNFASGRTPKGHNHDGWSAKCRTHDAGFFIMHYAPRTAHRAFLTNDFHAALFL